MYNTTPHSTTGETPTKLLRNFTIRSKIPSAEDIETAIPTSSGVRDRDVTLKHQGKEREDERRHAKPSDIRPGDSVLMQNLTSQSKMNATFKPTLFEVTGRNGSRATVMDTTTGATYERNVAHLKVFPPRPEGEEPPLQANSLLEPEAEMSFGTEIPVTSTPINHPPNRTRSRLEQIELPAHEGRPRRATSKPTWHQDYEVDCIEHSSL